MGDRCRVGGRQKLRLNEASSQIVFTLSIAEFSCPVFKSNIDYSYTVFPLSSCWSPPHGHFGTCWPGDSVSVSE